MASSSLKSRVKKIQQHLGIRADGVMGPVTLTKIEEAIGLEQADYSLLTSYKGLKLIIKFEISSQAYYKRALSKAVWPGGRSGVTIGIGYDLGYASATKIKEDWQGLVSDSTLQHIIRAAGKKGATAKSEASRLKRTTMKVPYKAAEEVFYKSTLPRYAKQTRRIYPGIEKLPADAQTMLLSLVYNRGSALSGSRRREMKAIKALVKKKDLAGIAEQFIAMKRLWENKGLPGLLKRRDKEAALIKKANHRYAKKDVVLL